MDNAMLLKVCDGIWGHAELRVGEPAIRSFTDAIYVPFDPGKPWGLFGDDGTPLEGSVDLHGPNGVVQDQILSWTGGAEAEASDEVWLYGGTLNPHFGHFLVNTLSRLWPLIQKERNWTKILFHGAANADAWLNIPFINDIFSALGIKSESFCIFDGATKIKRVVVPETSFQEQHFIFDSYRILCCEIGTKILGDRFVPEGLPPVYLSKSKLRQGLGHVVNEAILEAKFEAAGIEIVRPETLTLTEQIALFIDRPAVLGIVGSGFHTSIFAPTGANLLVLSTIPGPNSNFSLIDKVTGNRACYLYASGTQVVSNTNPAFHTSFCLPNPAKLADELLARLDTMVGPSTKLAIDRSLRPKIFNDEEHPTKVPNEDGQMSLYSMFLGNTGRPIHKSGHYFFAYERHFGRYVGKPVTFLEIGAGNGGSSAMWKRWLGPLAKIVTIDINPICKQFEDEQIAVRIGDQSDERFLQSVLEEFGTPDVVLDDGSHQMVHVNASFDYLYPKIAPSGTYMIEDMHTAYWSDYGGGIGQSASAVERFKSLIDVMNADHVRDGSVHPNSFTRTTIAMTAYDSILVFERAPIINKQMKIIGDNALRVNY